MITKIESNKKMFSKIKIIFHAGLVGSIFTCRFNLFQKQDKDWAKFWNILHHIWNYYKIPLENSQNNPFKLKRMLSKLQSKLRQRWWGKSVLSPHCRQDLNGVAECGSGCFVFQKNLMVALSGESKGVGYRVGCYGNEQSVVLRGFLKIL